MSILLDEMVKYSKDVEAKYWGLIFDICTAIHADRESYYDVMQNIYNCAVSKIIGGNNFTIEVCKLDFSLLFTIEINCIKVLWFELEGNVITEFGVDEPAGKSYVDVLEHIYTLL